MTLTDAAGIGIGCVALVLGIPSAAVALRDLRSHDGDRHGVGTAAQWTPPLNTNVPRQAVPADVPADVSSALATTPPVAPARRPPAPSPYVSPSNAAVTASRPPTPPGRPPAPARYVASAVTVPQPSTPLARPPDARAAASTPTRLAAPVGPLGLGRRALSFFLDYFFGILPYYVAFVLASFLAPAEQTSRTSSESGDLTAGGWALVAIGLALSVLVVVWNTRFDAVTGRTLGRWIVGGAVLDERTGLPIGFKRVALRSWWVVLSVACCLLGAIVPLSALRRPDRRSWTDRSADAVVVRFERGGDTTQHRPIVPMPGSAT